MLGTLTLDLDTSDMAQLRWAISPAWELLASVRALNHPAAVAIHLPWLAAHRDDALLTRPAARAARDLCAAPSHLPGFLAPTPDSPLRTVEEELKEVRATPADVVRRDLQACFPDTLPESLKPLMRAPRRELGRTVDQLEAYWDRTLAPHFPRLRAILQSDIHHRARTLTERGPATMFADIHPDLTFDPAAGRLAIAQRELSPADAHRSLDGRGLVLVPSAFAWPRVWVKTAIPWSPVIRYPVRGVGALWESADRQTDLAAALGETRARLMIMLDAPATTQDLARRAGLATGGVSTQLHKLAAAGLVEGHRTGRRVLYARTARGNALLA